MNRRIGFAVVLAAVVVAVAVWRGWSSESSSGDPAATGKPVAGSIAANRGKAPPDPKTLPRGSGAGTVTEEGKGPIAHAHGCADGSSEDLPHEWFREPACAH